MRGNRIEFISEYCDRWCERCAFTSRCSNYAVQTALGMCGDFEEALELAVGAARTVTATGGDVHSATDHWFDIPEPTQKELEEAGKEEDARKRRIDALPITKLAWRLSKAAYRWFRTHSDAVRARGDGVLNEALEIVEWDSHLIGAKLHRALSGRDRHETDECFDDDDPVQNDWNGSAKVALISLDRSEAAWQVIAQATGDVGAADLIATIDALKREVETTFPAARSFRRPGFDHLNS